MRNRTQEDVDRTWRDINAGSIDDVPYFILEFIVQYGCDDPEVDEMAHAYFYRLDNDF